jgi:ATP phosphoribosyltransferase regulatory subunit
LRIFAWCDRNGLQSPYVMTELERNALLPAGLRDVLPDDAAFEAEIVERLVAFLAARGYDRVKPPLIEFEDGLLSGAGVAVAPQTFRLMDPVSQRMMGLRADITPQIARIAGSRLVQSPRPLRLSYAGEVLRVRGSQLRPERQIVQVGAELIGSAAPTADAEIIVMAVEAIAEQGVGGLSVDLTVPRLVPSIFNQHALPEEDVVSVRAALDRKDSGTVGALAGSAAVALCALLSSTGPVDDALDKLDQINLPDAAAAERARVAEVVDLVRRLSPDIKLTLDPVEHRGFEYHTGIGFTVFATGASGDLATGGRYRTQHVDGEGSDGERATGFTLYVDSILSLLSPARTNHRLLTPYDTPPSELAALRKAGWITVMALEAVHEIATEASRLGCSHYLAEFGPEPIQEERVK